MLACWTVFSSPLVRIALLEDDCVGRLKGLVFAIAEDGTIATISPDGLELYMIYTLFVAHSDNFQVAYDPWLIRSASSCLPRRG